MWGLGVFIVAVGIETIMEKNGSQAPNERWSDLLYIYSVLQCMKVCVLSSIRTICKSIIHWQDIPFISFRKSLKYPSWVNQINETNKKWDIHWWLPCCVQQHFLLLVQLHLMKTDKHWINDYKPCRGIT
jgi:hypothetical protein